MELCWRQAILVLRFFFLAMLIAQPTWSLTSGQWPGHCCFLAKDISFSIGGSKCYFDEQVGGDVPFNGDEDIIKGLQPKHQKQVLFI